MIRALNNHPSAPLFRPLYHTLCGSLVRPADILQTLVGSLDLHALIGPLHTHVLLGPLLPLDTMHMQVLMGPLQLQHIKELSTSQ